MKTMKTILTTILSATLLTPFISFAGEGTNSGGGGGGYCQSKGCITFAQAALASNSLDSIFEIDDETREALKEISSQIPDYGFYLYRAAVGTPKNFKRITKIDKRLFRKVKADYLQVARAANLPSRGLEIFAISIKVDGEPITFLLPAYYRLTPFQKALKLIHEGVVRQTNSYEKALMVDNFILKLRNGTLTDFEKLKLYRILAMVSDNGVPFQSSVLSYVESRLGRPLNILDHLTGGLCYPGELIDCPDQKVIRTSQGFPEFWELFGHASVSSLGDPYRNPNALSLKKPEDAAALNRELGKAHLSVATVEAKCKAGWRSGDTLGIDSEGRVLFLYCNDGRASKIDFLRFGNVFSIREAWYSGQISNE